MVDSHGLFEGHDSPNKDLLFEWSRNVGISVHPSLRIIDSPYGGWGVISTSPIGLNELLCQVPKSALLSTRSSSLPPILPVTKDLTSHSILHLALALLHEMRLEGKSKWYGYLQGLPRETIKLPLFWGIEGLCGDDGKKGLEWLTGSEVEKDLRRRAAMGFLLPDLERFYTTCQPHLPSTRSHPNPSPLSAFLHAYSLICTRAFAIDLYHTVALVPFADLFNHASTLPNTSLSSDDFVCHICGSLAPCTHDPLNRNGEPFRLQHLDPLTRKKVGTEVDTVEMRVENDIQGKGEEVWNSYGNDIGDARLLVEWGFITGDFSGYGLTWDVEELVIGSSERIKEIWEVLTHTDSLEVNALDWRTSWKEKDQQEGIEEEQEEYLLCGIVETQPDMLNLSQSGEISINVWALCWILSTSHSSPSFSILTIGDDIVRSARRIQAIWNQDTTSIDRDERPDILATAKRIRSLLQDRLEGLHCSNLTVEALLDIQDKLGSEETLQRMALTLAINERSLLASTLSKWDEVISTLENAA